jgi:hypothetical protein
MSGDSGGILTILVVIVVLLGLIGILKIIISGKRNRFVVEIEQWLKTKDRRYNMYFEVDFPKKYPEFDEWRKNDKKEI